MSPQSKKLFFFWAALGLFVCLLAVLMFGLLSPPFVCSPICSQVNKRPLCLIVHRLGVPLFGYTLAILMVSGLAWGSATIARATISIRRHLASLDRKPLPDSPQVFLIPAGSLATAFSVGYFRPKVFITQALWRHLVKEEREGLLLHEAHHAKASDGLMLALLELISRAFFFIPLFFWLKERFREMMEFAADDAALTGGTGKVALASALLKVAKISPVAAPPSINPAFEQGLEVRVKRLLGMLPQEGHGTPPYHALFMSLPGVFWAIFPAVFSTLHSPSCTL
ncbi:MAG: M56 family metallopeptidase [Nitrospirota bacterium]|nr:M56 family metallopeptidase [Nitrospirota bacterium]